MYLLICCRYELKRYSLKIEPVYKNDSGRYACLAKNEFGQAWLNFTITVTGTPYTIDMFTFVKIYIFICLYVHSSARITGGDEWEFPPPTLRLWTPM